MKRILTTTALALTMGSTAFAASHTSGEGDTDTNMTSQANSPFIAADGNMQAELRASDITGMRVYTSNQPVENQQMNNASEDWNDVGEVNDVLLARDGSIEAILLDIGGFLGIGEKQIAVRMSELNFVTDGDTDGDFFVVFAADQAALENAPEYDASNLYGWLEEETNANEQAMNENMQGNDGQTGDMAASGGMDGSGDMSGQTEGENADMAASGDMANQTEGENADMAASGDMANQAEGENADMAASDGTAENTEGGMNRGFQAADLNALTAEDLTGTPAFGTNGERVGEVAELLIDQEEITDVVINFGGFLGIGEKAVRLPIDDVNIERSTNDQSLRVTVDVSEQEIEQMQEYEG
ncbi:PRC-barrel domain-containing protein [Anianabacter salinae]|uniref:PRC-barrel domain-containing protein n=1 Tax=Anianabacter salinae TaxID=2851023 RepID=UPI00225DCEBB|nr:PRC-barrel domain-containing protein [Anianabacter salinae]MBV0910765.1 PRC-barrel domain-containing protein [Anianabacter salinae]